MPEKVEPAGAGKLGNLGGGAKRKIGLPILEIKIQIVCVALQHPINSSVDPNKFIQHSHDQPLYALKVADIRIPISLTDGTAGFSINRSHQVRFSSYLAWISLGLGLNSAS